MRSDNEEHIDKDVVEDGSVNFTEHPIRRSLTGGWKASVFIIGVDIAENLAFFSIASNLVLYLTNVFQESAVSAAKKVNIWTGVVATAYFLGAFVADAYLGHYRIILISSIFYVLGLLVLIVSITLTSLKPPQCEKTLSPCTKTKDFLHKAIFFFGLYLIPLAMGGLKPCLPAFGAKQFDDNNPEERKSKMSFFNWLYFSYSGATLVALTVIVYIEDNLGWNVGLGIPAIAMTMATCIFLLWNKFISPQSSKWESH